MYVKHSKVSSFDLNLVQGMLQWNHHTSTYILLKWFQMLLFSCFNFKCSFTKPPFPFFRGLSVSRLSIPKHSGQFWVHNIQFWYFIYLVKKTNFASRILLFYMFMEMKFMYILGVKVRNMKMDFNTGGTWRRVGQWTLMMKIYDFFLFG